MKPVRIHLSRQKGFDLQKVSRALNGLEAVNVARPGRWGNPYSVAPHHKPGAIISCRYIAVPTVEDAVAVFREALRIRPADFPHPAELRGKNLACWCKAGSPCHADVLIGIANR